MTGKRIFRLFTRSSIELLFRFRIQDCAGGTALPQKFLETLAFYLDMISFKTSLLFFKERDPKVKEKD
jgi:hypothetical protein